MTKKTCSQDWPRCFCLLVLGQHKPWWVQRHFPGGKFTPSTEYAIWHAKKSSSVASMINVVPVLASRCHPCRASTLEARFLQWHRLILEFVRICSNLLTQLEGLRRATKVSTQAEQPLNWEASITKWPMPARCAFQNLGMQSLCPLSWESCIWCACLVACQIALYRRICYIWYRRYRRTPECKNVVSPTRGSASNGSHGLAAKGHVGHSV